MSLAWDRYSIVLSPYMVDATLFQVSVTGMGCSIGAGQSNFHLVHWHSSQCFTFNRNTVIIIMISGTKWSFHSIHTSRPGTTTIYNSIATITYPVSHIIAEGLRVVSGRYLSSSLTPTKMTAAYSIIMVGFQNFPFRSVIRNYLNITSIYRMTYNVGGCESTKFIISNPTTTHQ